HEPAIDDRVASPSRQLRALQGRIALQKGRELIVEIVADGALDWQPAGEGFVEWSGGETVDAAVDTTRTSAPGRPAPGTILRVVLRLTADPPVGAPRTITLGDLRIEV